MSSSKHNNGKLSYNQPRDFRQCISDEKTKKRWIEQMKEEPPKDPDIP
jgi:hypothetical protein